MTEPHSQHDHAPRAAARGSLGLAARAAGTGLAAAAIPVAVALLSGALPEGAAGFVLGGAALAGLVGILGCGLVARMARTPAGSDGRLQAQRFQVTLGLTLFIKLLAVAAGLGALWWQGVKFPYLAAFAIAFAAVAMVFQVVGAVTMARLLGRAHAGRSADLSGSASKPSSATTD